MSIASDIQALGRVICLEPWEAKFWARVQKSGPNDCWLWQGCTDTHGYGMVRLAYRAHRSHRIAYLLTHGDFWGILLHSCDTPLCCNPSHLTPGTHADNVRDRDSKGRHVALRGSAHGCALLTEEQVSELRTLFSKGVSRQELASRFGIAHSHTCNIINRRCWRNVK